MRQCARWVRICVNFVCAGCLPLLAARKDGMRARMKYLNNNNWPSRPSAEAAKAAKDSGQAKVAGNRQAQHTRPRNRGPKARIGALTRRRNVLACGDSWHLGVKKTKIKNVCFHLPLVVTSTKARIRTKKREKEKNSATFHYLGARYLVPKTPGYSASVETNTNVFHVCFTPFYCQSNAKNGALPVKGPALATPSPAKPRAEARTSKKYVVEARSALCCWP